MKSFDEMVFLFENANQAFILQNRSLFQSQVAERTLCGALMVHLRDLVLADESLSHYYVDVEYNRNKGKIKTVKKTIRGLDEQVIAINCDLILHSRGEHLEQDNLIAVEMKKSNRPRLEKLKDRERLIALTRDSFDNVWAYDGHSLPEHVCRYVLGVYYEINYNSKKISIEYYKQGNFISSYTLKFF